MSLGKQVFGLGIALFVVLAPGTVWGQGLLGSEVAAELLFPTIGDVFAGPIVKTVDDTVEFPSGTFDPLRGFSIEVTDSQVIYTAGENTTYGVADFNGFGLTFTGAPTFTSVTLDASSTFSPTSFVWNENSLDFNLSGLTVQPTDQIVFNVNPIPEPSALLMIAGGVGAAVALRLRKRAGRAT